MPEPRPELIFVNGPQKGDRSVLMANLAIMGRATTAEVQLREEFASRQHAKFELTHEGWVIQSLSSLGIRVNGKKYKPGKKIIVETGDVIGVGAETEILFVSAGDDPEVSLKVYYQKNPTGAKQVEVEEGAEKPEAAPSQPAAASALAATAQAPAPSVAPAPALAPPAGKEKPPEVAVDPELAAARARTVKLKKYATYGAIYLVVIVGLVFVLSQFKKPPPKGSPADLLAELTPEKIREVLELKYKLPKDLTQADKYLSKARDWATDTVIPGNQYKALKCFKLYLAYQGVAQPTFQEPADQRQYEELLRSLSARITDLYRQAYVFEQRTDWWNAQRYFWKILKMVPAKDEPYPEQKNALFDNLTAHLEHVSNKLQQSKAK
jgi:pSer/pThr/pTyr-binding forkhead associated (FHA) protein